MAFNAPSLAKFGPAVRENGLIIYDSSVIREPGTFAPGVKVIGVPLSQTAKDLGEVRVKNIVAVGALQAATNIFPAESFLAVIRAVLGDKCALIPLNEAAFGWGQKVVRQMQKP